ncbi:hypothetical protein [uncultured Sphingomonas sp.]|uniref:hypothetical protein n=1 Tax=uncultured Sphingomonas sp. TaxID=158754 RepID=UPI00258688B4|nr:hypothetical protein [uncultured Sphingomonas sp.]
MLTTRFLRAFAAVSTLALLAGASDLPTAAQAPVAAVDAAASVRDQLAAERRALRLIARPDVQRVFGKIERAWRDGTPGLLPETYAQLPQAVRELALLTALQAIAGDAQRPGVVEISASPHRWHGLTVPGGRWGINNPDTLYFLVPVAPGARYVITGQRHGRGPVDANYSLQKGDGWETVANIAQDALQIDAQGRYRIEIDNQPANGRPNHLQIRDGANAVLIRNTLADWSRELPDTLAVTRLGPAPTTPAPSDDALAAQIVERLHATVRRSTAALQPPILSQPANVIPQPGPIADKPGFLVTQRNTLGHFRLADNEALVATFDPGGAAYATFPVTSIWGITPDPDRYQNSLNTAQAARNPDGTITVVLSRRDPGVVNWIDPGGLREGIVMLRWQRLAATAPAGGGPAVTTQVVKLNALSAMLPAGTKHITPAERAQQRVARASGFARRFAAR